VTSDLEGDSGSKKWGKRRFRTGLKEVMMGSVEGEAPHPVGLSLTLTLTLPEAVEVNTVV